MPDDYKSSPQWQALNRIWKSVPPQSRDSVKEDFRLITELVRAQTDIKPAADVTPAPQSKQPLAPRENVMSGLSRAAKSFFLGLVTKEGFDVCAFLQSLIDEGAASDAEQLFDAYVSRRDIDEEDTDALMEIIAALIG